MARPYVTLTSGIPRPPQPPPRRSLNSAIYTGRNFSGGRQQGGVLTFAASASRRLRQETGSADHRAGLSRKSAPLAKLQAAKAALTKVCFLARACESRGFLGASRISPTRRNSHGPEARIV